jgi:DNA-binding FadR family transcriptional regulator
MGAILLESRRQFEGGQNLANVDEAFHLALIAGAKNDILLRMAKSLYLMTRSVREVYFRKREYALVSIAEHGQLLESVRRRAPDKSAVLMRQHYAGSSARWRRVQIP